MRNYILRSSPDIAYCSRGPGDERSHAMLSSGKIIILNALESLSKHYRAADGGQPAVFRVRQQCKVFSFYVVVIISEVDHHHLARHVCLPTLYPGLLHGA
jgi:hypothetical protein